jgi:hypothetical protein
MFVAPRSTAKTLAEIPSFFSLPIFSCGTGRSLNLPRRTISGLHSVRELLQWPRRPPRRQIEHARWTALPFFIFDSNILKIVAGFEERRWHI